MLPPQINKTIITLHINAVCNILMGLACFGLGIAMMIFGFDSLASDEDLFASAFGLAYIMFIALVLIGLGVFIEVIIYQLKQNRYWAWVAAIIICGINLPSLYFIFGVIGLIGLVNKTVAKHYIDCA